MGYIAPKDYSQDEDVLAAVMRRMSGDLELDWMERTGEPAEFRAKDARRGLTLDDINQGGYGPEHVPEIVRHNFSMAPRGALLPRGLPSLGYTLNRKSDVWSEQAARIFEEGKSRHWAPARDVPWEELETERDPRAKALSQIATGLSSIGLLASDVAARAVYRMNIEFHEVKYLLCVQMIDGARIAEAFRKRALAGAGSLGVDSRALGELLKMILDSDSYPQASVSMNLLLFSFAQALARYWEYLATNRADAFLGAHLAQDASRFLAYGVDHIRQLTTARPAERDGLNDHLDLVENGWVGALGAPEILEPLVVVSGALEPVVELYRRTAREYFERCRAAGLGDRRARSPVPDFLAMLRE